MKKDKQLEAIIEDFGDALRNAHPPFIANNGKMTCGMEILWALYVQHMQSKCKKGEVSYNKTVYRA